MPTPRYLILFLVTLGCGVIRAAAPATQGAELIARFDQLVADQTQAAIRAPAGNDQGNLAWGESYLLHALAEMLEATRDPKYADLFVRLADWAIAGRDDRHGRRDEYRHGVLKAWSSTKYTEGKRYVWAVHTGMIAAPMAQFASVIRRDPGLRVRFGAAADRILAAAQEAVAEHDEQYRAGPGPDEGYLLGLSLNRNLPLNMQNALARAWIYIDDATGTDSRRKQTAALARFFRNRIRDTDDGAYAWAYWADLDGPGRGFEDISHAAINVDFAVLCHERGIVFAADDVRRLEKTLLHKVGLATGQIAGTVGGTGTGTSYAGAILRWGRLAAYNPRIRDRLIAVGLAPDAQAANPSSVPLGIAYLVRAGARANPPAPTATGPSH